MRNRKVCRISFFLSVAAAAREFYDAAAMSSRREPRKDDADKRTETIGVRVTPSQKRAIEQAARKLTLDPSVWVRMVALREANWNPDDED